MSNDTAAQAGAGEPAEAWIVVKEYAWHHEDGGRPTLAYLWPAEFGRKVFPSGDEASAFIKEQGLPIGWVRMKLTLPVPAGSREPAGWRCFHCDEAFTDRAAAQEHFGPSEHDKPICQMDASYIRWLLEQHRRNVDDDSEALRAVGRLTSEHETLRRKAEEQGYARGIADAKKHPEDLGLVLAGSRAAEADQSARERAMDALIADSQAMGAYDAGPLRVEGSASEAATAVCSSDPSASGEITDAVDGGSE